MLPKLPYNYLALGGPTGNVLPNGSIAPVEKPGAFLRPKLRYDGRMDWLQGEGEDGRRWTILSHFMDKLGRDLFKSTVGRLQLHDLGVL